VRLNVQILVWSNYYHHSIYDRVSPLVRKIRINPPLVRMIRLQLAIGQENSNSTQRKVRAKKCCVSSSIPIKFWCY